MKGRSPLSVTRVLMAVWFAGVLAGMSLAAEPTLAPSPEQVNAALQAEMAEETYTIESDEQYRGKLTMALIRRMVTGLGPMIDWLGQTVGGALSVLGITGGIVGTLVQIALIGIGVVVLLAIAYFVFRLILARRDRVLLSALQTSAVEHSGDHELLSLTARRALRSARKAQAEGHPNLALRYTFWALILALAEAGRYKVAKGRTNREYERLLPEGSDERGLFAEASGVFEGCWFGGRNATSDVVTSLMSRVEPEVSAARGRSS